MAEGRDMGDHDLCLVLGRRHESHVVFDARVVGAQCKCFLCEVVSSREGFCHQNSRVDDVEEVSLRDQ